ncbi:YdcF family protein [bacterium]|nr:YdcF family protein [bacterium]
MSILILAGLLLIVFLNLLFKKYARAFVFLTLFTAMCAFIGTGFITQKALDSLQIHPRLKNFEWHESNVIVLLGGGTAKWDEDFQTPGTVYPRLLEASRLYQQCKKQSRKCFVLVTGGDPLKLGKAEADVMASELISLNINSADILTEKSSHNTFENAKLSSVILKEKAFDSVVLVTSSTHMLRALAMFAFFGIAATPAPADHIVVANSWKHMSGNFVAFDAALHEYAGLIQFYFILSKDKTSGAVTADSF